MRIKELRKEKGFTQKELSDRSNVSQGKICEYETGKVLPRIDTALKLATALGCTLDQLMESELSDKAG